MSSFIPSTARAWALLLVAGLLGEPASLPRTASLLLIVAGVVGLRVFSGA